MFACQVPVLVQAQCFEEDVLLTDEPRENVYIIDSTYKTNLIKLDEEEFPEFIYLAIKMGEEDQRFKISVQQGVYNKLVTISLKDQKKLGKAGIFYKVDQNLNTINYGGDITLTKEEYLRMEGGGTSQMNQSTTIFHNQEVVLLRINLKKFTLEPVLNQYAYFHFPSGQGRGLFNISFQPASAGLYLKTALSPQKNARVGLTAGPNIELRQHTDKTINSEFLGIVNLRFAVDL